MKNPQPDIMGFSKKDVLGAFAKWAVWQSPYYVPDNLEKALRSLADFLPTYEFLDPLGYKEIPIRDFHKWFMDIILRIPEVVAWNSPKDGSNPMFGFVSAFSKSIPDADFLDLDALTINVKNELVKTWNAVYNE